MTVSKLAKERLNPLLFSLEIEHRPKKKKKPLKTDNDSIVTQSKQIYQKLKSTTI